MLTGLVSSTRASKKSFSLRCAHCVAKADDEEADEEADEDFVGSTQLTADDHARQWRTVVVRCEV